MSYTITKIKCPSCNGSGRCDMLGFVCQWCGGIKRMAVDKAKRWADTIYMFAGGGYIAGDHDYDHMRKMEAEAKAVYTLIGEKPSWVK